MSTIDNHPVKWADKAMFQAEPHDGYTPDRGVEPKVHLLWMTPDPLGAVAAMSEMYKGNVIRSLDDVTDEMRRSALADVQKTHLKAPLEAVKVHFMIDGVDRSFTHQQVRQRTAVFAQESMRFAVVEDLRVGTTLPPSLFGTEPWDAEADLLSSDRQQNWRDAWDRCLKIVSDTYTFLVNDGMPAEDARGLLPHATATRLNYVTDLRNLSDHAGNRLCTQAQYHWRYVFSQIANEIRNYGHRDCHAADEIRVEDCEQCAAFSWQFVELAKSGLFRPVCYQLGHCPFNASFDRACSIRDRVESFSRSGTPSEQWVMGDENTPPIDPREWAFDPSAAREAM